MSKELEALERMYCSGNLQLNYVLSNKHKQDYETIEQALKRLESIDNAKPSEALEYIEILAGELGTSKDAKFAETRFPKMLITIQRALLKSQEPKQYLKWEDLDFSFKEKYMKVKLNGNIYTLRYTRNGVMEFPVAYLEFNNTEITIIDCKKQFFNDLHLEVLNNE